MVELVLMELITTHVPVPRRILENSAKVCQDLHLFISAMSPYSFGKIPCKKEDERKVARLIELTYSYWKCLSRRTNHTS